MRFPLLLGVLVLSGTVSAQDGKVRLEWRRTVGDRAKIRMNSEVEVVTIATDAEGEKTYELSTRTETEVQQLVEKAEGGQASQLRIDCRRSWKQTGLQAGKTDMEGRSFSVRRTPPATSVAAVDGGGVPPEAQVLCGWEDAAFLVPANEVATGDSWNVEASKVTGILSVGDLSGAKGELRARLESLVDGKATIRFSGTLEGVTGDGFSARVTVTEGRLELIVGSASPVSISVEGGFELSKTVSEKKMNERLEEVVTEIGKVTVRSRKLKVGASFE